VSRAARTRAAEARAQGCPGGRALGLQLAEVALATTKADLTATLLTAKKTRALPRAQLATAAELFEVFTTSACLGENALPAPAAARVAAALGLEP
jgi:hypothetical protein